MSTGASSSGSARPLPTPARRLALLRRASWVGIAGNLLLALMKIIIGLISGSLAVVGDGVDSLVDVVTSIVTLYAANAGSAPPDPEHPWGHGRMETIATKTLSLIIIMAGLQILMMTIRKLTGTADIDMPDGIAAWAVGLSIPGKIGLAAYKARAARLTGSRMMQADAMNMKNDILLSLTVLTGVLFTRILKLPVIDLVAGLAVSVWIILSGVRVFLRTNTELMDSVENRDVYRDVFGAVDAVDGVVNPHRVRIRSLNTFYVIDIDVEVDGGMTIAEAHVLSCRVETEIRKKISRVYDIMVHVEPVGVADHGEGYGLAPSDFEPVNIDNEDN